MGNHYFTEEQVEELRKNPYVKNVSDKSITYEEKFKELFVNDYNDGMNPTAIFRKYGFDTNILGSKRVKTFTERVKNQAERFCGFEDQRKYSSGRPRIKDLSDEEKIQKLELKIKTLKQENDFLKRVRYINRKQISKTSKTLAPEKDMNSSKGT